MKNMTDLTTKSRSELKRDAEATFTMIQAHEYVGCAELAEKHRARLAVIEAELASRKTRKS